MRLLSFFTIAVVATLQTFAQQRISLPFTQVALREDFREPNDMWPMLATLENIYTIDKDEYFMHRRNTGSPYAIMMKWENMFTNYQILSSLKLGPMEREEQTIGVICQVQVDGKGGFVMEINRSKQVRVKQLVGNYYRYVTGTPEGRGWEKANVRKEEYNEFEIRVAGPQIDFYLNKKFIASADAPDYKPGTMGLIIGPDTKAKADFFYVLTTNDGYDGARANEQGKREKLSVQEELVKVKFDLEQANRSLSAKEIELRQCSEMNRIKIEQITSDNENLMMRIRTLQAFKDQLDVEIDGDVFLTLATNLRDELKKNAILEHEVAVYKDSLRVVSEKFRKFRLTVLDGAITKAERDKKKREADDAVQTAAAIQAELKEKKWKEEQEKFEAERRKTEAAASSKITPQSKAEAQTKIDEAKKKIEALKATEAKTQAATQPVAPANVAPEPGKAQPLPIPTRKAVRSAD